MTLLPFSAFCDRVNGGEARLTPGHPVSYALITDADGAEVFYSEWQANDLYPPDGPGAAAAYAEYLAQAGAL